VLAHPGGRAEATRGAVRTPLYLDLDGLAPEDLALVAECLPALSEIAVDELFDRTIALLLSAMSPVATSGSGRSRRRGR
jgi:hypothetical protein